MKFRNPYTKILSIKLVFFFSLIWANQVQLITTHKKSNGTLLRIVTSSVLDSENIAGWSGQENWFYITLNGTQLSSSSRDYITFEPPLLDIEILQLVDLEIKDKIIKLKNLINNKEYSYKAILALSNFIKWINVFFCKDTQVL